MFTRTRPFSQRYQVATVFGLPSDCRVAMTDGLGSLRNLSISGGRGGLGMAGFYPCRRAGTAVIACARSKVASLAAIR